MSGTRHYNWREGDRSEYLAVYMFSAFGLVTAVPRQEDIGFDLVCSIADREKGRLSFNNQYLVSVKSLSSPNINLFPTGKDDEELLHFKWLFTQELPLLLSVVDKENEELRIFSTLPVWFLLYENMKDCGSVSLLPRIDLSNTSNVDRPTKGSKVQELPGRYHYDVDLGFPVVRIRLQDLRDEEQLRNAKARLRLVVHHGQLSANYFHFGVPYFYWFAKTSSDGSEAMPAFYATKVPHVQEAQEFVLDRIAPALISLAMHYKDTGQMSKLAAASELLKSAPPASIPTEVKQHLNL